MAWGLEWNAFREDEGEKAATSISAALTRCSDVSLPTCDRFEIADCISRFVMMTSDSLRIKPLVAAAPQVFAIIEEILLTADDKDVPADDYDKNGLQSVAAKFANSVQFLATMNATFAEAAWAPSIAVLGLYLFSSYLFLVPKLWK